MSSFNITNGNGNSSNGDESPDHGSHFQSLPSDHSYDADWDVEQIEVVWNDDMKAYLAEQESKVAEEIIATILTGKTDSLKPNSSDYGQINYVQINGHYLCVTFSENEKMGCREWIWRGLISMYDEQGRYFLQFTMDDYLEQIPNKENENETADEESSSSMKAFTKLGWPLYIG